MLVACRMALVTHLAGPLFPQGVGLGRSRLCSCLRAAAESGNGRLQPASACSQPDALAARVHQTPEQDIGIRKRQLLVVSVSAGADSVALLRLLLAVQEHWKLRLHVLHFNHGLRDEADAEEAFVCALSAEHALPCHVYRLPRN